MLVSLQAAPDSVEADTVGDGRDDLCDDLQRNYVCTL